MICLQKTYASHSSCFGCGPANPKGLQVQSMAPELELKPSIESLLGARVIAAWKPEAHHEAFPGMLNGGIIGSLLDCHSNWTVAWFLMKQAGLTTPPCTVTADYSIKLKRPTPTDGLVTLSARITDYKEDRATVEAELMAGGKVCATCIGTFVAVQPGHPAYHRW
jgi:acyl-coenzyme A thioesterase PaaI-like protein